MSEDLKAAYARNLGDLRGADLRNAVLEGAYLEGAVLRGAWATAAPAGWVLRDGRLRRAS